MVSGDNGEGGEDLGSRKQGKQRKTGDGGSEM